MRPKSGRTQVNPKSLANLRPPKKGEPSRNPLGRNISPVTARIRKMTAEELTEICTFLLDSNIYALKQIVLEAQGPDKQGNPLSEFSSLKVWIAQVAMKGIARGDYSALDCILNRVVGKVTTSVHVSAPDGGPIRARILAMTPEQCQSEIDRLQKIQDVAGND